MTSKPHKPGQPLDLRLRETAFSVPVDGLPDPVLVVGMHNSGTSLLAGIVHASGIFLGNNMAHCESHFFSIFINDTLILGGDRNWIDPPDFNETRFDFYSRKYRRLIRDGWYYDYLQWGYDGVSKWGIKDPRLCLLLPIYLKIFSRPKIVYIERNPYDVAHGLTEKSKMHSRGDESFDTWLKLTERYQCDARRNITNTDHIKISYEDLCSNPKPVAGKVLEFLDQPPNREVSCIISGITAKRVGSYDKGKSRRGLLPGSLAPSFKRILG